MQSKKTLEHELDYEVDTFEGSLLNEATLATLPQSPANSNAENSSEKSSTIAVAPKKPTESEE